MLGPIVRHSGGSKRTGWVNAAEILLSVARQAKVRCIKRYLDVLNATTDTILLCSGRLVGSSISGQRARQANIAQNPRQEVASISITGRPDKCTLMKVFSEEI